MTSSSRARPRAIDFHAHVIVPEVYALAAQHNIFSELPTDPGVTDDMRKSIKARAVTVLARTLRAALPALALALGAAHADAGDLTVSAAASLSNAFREIATAFEAAHPDAAAVLDLRPLRGAQPLPAGAAGTGAARRVSAAGQSGHRPRLRPRR